jgi:hypothetical protein
MRTTRVIETPGGPMLFSPVAAHSLSRGDIVAPWTMTAGTPWPVHYVNRDRTDEGRERNEVWLGLETVAGEPPVPNLIGLNAPVLRAVGARCGGLR